MYINRPKSSLLRCLYRVNRPWRGSIQVYGEDVWRLPPREAARRAEMSFVLGSREGTAGLMAEAYGRQEFGIEAIEYVNSFFKDKATNAAYLAEMNRRAAQSLALDGDLVLMDYAPDVCNYTSDIGRMWPVNGRFSPEQRAVYEVVLEAQEERRVS